VYLSLERSVINQQISLQMMK